MNRSLTRTIALVLCGALCLGSILPAFAADAEENSEIKKNETVYALIQPDGATSKIIVSDWLENASGEAKIEDVSELTDIENTNGEETFEISDNQVIWSAQENDIYYQGSIEKELPVIMSVTYLLDGKEISADELEGKSGKVSIRFDYENTQYEMVDVDGEQEKIYVPFVVLTGMLLDNDAFRNIEVTNGRIINDGTRTIVIGVAMPGLQESLGIEKDDLEIPDYVEITADVTDYSSGTIVAVATNELFNNLDTMDLNYTDDQGKVIETVSEGIDKLIETETELKDGVTALDDGALKLKEGAATLSEGLETLKGNNEALTGGAGQVFETLLATAESKIRESGMEIPALTIENYESVLDELLLSLSEEAVYNQAREQVVAGVTAAVESQVTEQVIQSAANMSAADYETAVSNEQITPEIQQAISSQIEIQMNSEEVLAMIEAKTDEQMQTEEVQTKLFEAAEGAKALTTVKESLDNYNTFYQGLISYTDGVASAADGAAELAAGASDLNDGTTQFKDKMVQLDDMPIILSRLKATIDVSKNYYNFAGIADDMEGQVKFIYRG